MSSDFAKAADFTPTLTLTSIICQHSSHLPQSNHHVYLLFYPIPYTLICPSFPTLYPISRWAAIGLRSRSGSAVGSA